MEPSRKIHSILYSKLNLSSTRHGIQYENEALKRYTGDIAKKDIFLDVEHSGLIVSKTHPYLGASLDAIVTDIYGGEKWGIEIKCPSSKYNQQIDDVLKDQKILFAKSKWNYKIENNTLLLLSNSRPNVLYWVYKS